MLPCVLKKTYRRGYRLPGLMLIGHSTNSCSRRGSGRVLLVNYVIKDDRQSLIPGKRG
jgi:hypothetical protein